MSKIFDLSTLNLSAGTHEITVKARASDYADSPVSDAVSYVVQGEETYTVSGTWVLNENLNNMYIDGVRQQQFYNLNFSANGNYYHGIGNELPRGSGGDYLYYLWEVGDKINIYGGFWENTEWLVNSTYRTIVIEGTQTIPKVLYDWLNKNAERIDVIPVEAGTWVFKDSLNTAYIDAIDIIPLKFMSWDGVDELEGAVKQFSSIRHDTGEFCYDGTYVATADGKWKSNLYKTIIVAEHQTVTQKHYSWFTDNARYYAGN